MFKYFDYAPTDEVLYQERQQEKALMEEGWTFIRIKWQDLFREQEFKMRVLQALHPLRQESGRPGHSLPAHGS